MVCEADQHVLVLTFAPHGSTGGSCEPCRRNLPERCVLILNGVVHAPSEWAQIARLDDEISPKEQAVTEMFGRMEKSLTFGSTALLRVDPTENDGNEFEPIIVGRKAPCAYTAQYARDGMFDFGDTMVWIHELAMSPSGEYKVPRELGVDETKAVPIKCLAGPGQGITRYMNICRCEEAGDVSTQAYRLRRGVVENARSKLVMMTTNPTNAFRDFQPVPLSESDQSRAFVRQSLFPVGTVVRKGFKAPRWGSRQKAWSGELKLDAEVAHIATFIGQRRHYYRLKWKGTPRNRALANVPKDVDEGFIERYVVNDQ